MKEMGVKKRCSRCGTYKELSHFHKNPGKSFGVCTHCKQCKKEVYQERKNGNN